MKRNIDHHVRARLGVEKKKIIPIDALVEDLTKIQEGTYCNDVNTGVNQEMNEYELSGLENIMDYNHAWRDETTNYEYMSYLPYRKC